MLVLQGAMRPDEALKILAVFEGKLSRLKEERDNLAKAKEALELAEPGDFWFDFNICLHCVQKKTPTHVSFYISMGNVQISIKFSANI